MAKEAKGNKKIKSRLSKRLNRLEGDFVKLNNRLDRRAESEKMQSRGLKEKRFGKEVYIVED